MENMLLTHYTHWRNIEAIRQKGVLLCALSLMNKREQARLAGTKRDKSEQVSCGAILNDQQPLNRVRLVFSDGARFDDFVRYLNGHVFFWPNNYAGEQARNNFRGKYRHPGHIGLRCPLADLREKHDILYSPYNSGSMPRIPDKYPRHLNLFQPIEKRGDQRLVEVVVRGKVYLPKNTKVEYENGEWRPFFRP
ncbi:MAG: DUF7002 family protein [Gammaproteobacteria bacterium]